MINAAKIQGVPKQYKGAYHDTESRKHFDDAAVLSRQFEMIRDRFFNINCWKEFCGEMSSDFRLFNKAGVYAERMPQEGDYIRIDIPGPGDFREKGYDWVRIVKIDERIYERQLERCLIICRPSSSPGSKSGHIAHFYAPAASSSFLLERGSDYILVGVYGRNEIPNFSETGFIGKVRNFLIYIGGVLRITKIQWKSLSDGLIDL